MSLSLAEAMRLASKGGAADGLRRRLIAACATLATVPVILAVGVLAVYEQGWRGPAFELEFLRHPEPAAGAVTALALFAVPLILLACESSRVGSVARNARFRAMRAAGATMHDVRRVVVVETVVLASMGALGGVPLSLCLWWVLGGLRVSGAALLPDGVWPQPWHVLLAVLVVPATAAGLAPFAVRRGQVGVAVQGSRGQGFSPWRPVALLTVGALALVGVFVGLGDGGVMHVLVGVLVVLGSLFLTLGLAGAAPFASRLVGGQLVRRGGAVAVLAGRGMRATPDLAGRAGAGLVMVGLIAGVVASLGGSMRADLARMVAQGYTAAGGDPDFYLVPLRLGEIMIVIAATLGVLGLFIAVAEHVAVRSASLVRHLASGVPLRTLRTVMVVEVTLPLTATVLVSMAVASAGASLLLVVAGQPLQTNWLLLGALVVVLTAGTAGVAWLGSGRIRGCDDVWALRDR